MGNDDLDGCVGGEVDEAVDGDAIPLTDRVVVGGVGEREGEHALLLEVGLVDAGERAGDHGAGAPEAGLHGGVLA